MDSNQKQYSLRRRSNSLSQLDVSGIPAIHPDFTLPGFEISKKDENTTKLDCTNPSTDTSSSIIPNKDAAQQAILEETNADVLHILKHVNGTAAKQNEFFKQEMEELKSIVSPLTNLMAEFDSFKHATKVKLADQAGRILTLEEELKKRFPLKKAKNC